MHAYAITVDKILCSKIRLWFIKSEPGLDRVFDSDPQCSQSRFPDWQLGLQQHPILLLGWRLLKGLQDKSLSKALEGAIVC